MDTKADSAWYRAGMAGSLFLICFGILAFHANYYMPFVSDDALISLRYADRLLEGKGLTWTEGRPVEGYSNLLWLLLTALLGAAGIDLIAAARILGFVFMGVVILAVLAWYASSERRPVPWFTVLVGLLFFVLAAPSAVWTIGGLEQPLFAAALACAIPLYWLAIGADRPPVRTTLALSFALGVMCLTRPDGPIFTAAVVSSALLGRYVTRRPQPWSFVFRVSMFPVLFYGGQLVFRLAYYGEWIPNTALVKITPSSSHFLRGMAYAANGLTALAPFSFLAFASILVALKRRETQERAMLLFVLPAFWLVYIILVGGDVFPAYRHFIPVIVVGTFALIEGIEMLWGLLKERRAVWRVAIGLVLAALFAPYVVIQFKNAESKKALHETWEWAGKAIGLVLNEAFSDKQPLFAVTAAGCLPYWSELPCVDMMGLNDYHIPRHKPEGLGRGFLGHELGDGAYVLRRRPDIICYHIGYKDAVFVSGWEMEATKEYHELYTPVQVHGTVPHAHTAWIWFLKYSEKIGIQKTPARIAIPGFLLNSNPNTIAFLHNGRLVVPVRAGEPAGIALDGIDHPDWEIEVRSPDAGKIECRLEHDETTLSLTLSTGSLAPLPIEQVVLTKVPSGSETPAGRQP